MKLRQLKPGTGLSKKTKSKKLGSWGKNDRLGRCGPPTRHLHIHVNGVDINMRCELQLRHTIEDIATQENVSMSRVCHMLFRLGIMAYRQMQAHPQSKTITISLEEHKTNV
jgi:hypothetical protein